MWLLLACSEPADPGAYSPVVDTPADSGRDSPSPHSDSPTDSANDSDIPLTADYLFDGTTAPEPLIGIGGQVWAGDTAWEPALDMLDARLVRIAVNANLGSSSVNLPVDATASEWDAWMTAHIQDQAPSFLQELLDAQAAFDSRSMTWIGPAALGALPVG